MGRAPRSTVAVGVHRAALVVVNGIGDESDPHPAAAWHGFEVYRNLETLPLGSDSIMNENVFKKNPGFGGRITVGPTATGTPIVGQTVQLKSGDKVLATVQTDADGYYAIAYKQTGKIYTVVVAPPFVSPATSSSQTVTLKSSSFVEANFVY